MDPVTPEFSESTAITNPLLPIAELNQVIHLGEWGGQRARVEVTLLPETRVIEWDGGRVEALVSQAVSYADGEIMEVGVDLFAQADDGSVWYFGAEVDEYEDGVIVDNAGSWLAGRDGPPGMIMPAQPAVGDVFRPENIPGVAYEEVRVLSTTEHVETARGSVDGGVMVEVHQIDGMVEHKVYVPGYGEFRTEADDELLLIAMAFPTDARSAPVPGPLAALISGVMALYDRTADGKAGELAASLAGLEASLAELEENTPPILFDEVAAALHGLRAAAETGATDFDVRRASCEAALRAIDLGLQYSDQGATDLWRMAVWARLAALDAGTGDLAAVRSDVAVLQAIWARTTGGLDAMAQRDVSDALIVLRDAVDREDLASAATSSAHLVQALEDARASAQAGS